MLLTLGGIAVLVGLALLVFSLASWLVDGRVELSANMCLVVVAGWACLAVSNVVGILFGNVFDALFLLLNGYLAVSWFGRYRDRRGNSF